MNSMAEFLLNLVWLRPALAARDRWSRARLKAHQRLALGRLLVFARAARWRLALEPGLLHVLLAGAPGDLDDGALARTLARALREHGALPPDIRIERVPDIPRGLTGKALPGAPSSV